MYPEEFVGMCLRKKPFQIDGFRPTFLSLNYAKKLSWVKRTLLSTLPFERKRGSPRAIARDHSPPTVPRNILSTDLLLAPDREPGYEMRAAGLPADGGSAIGAHPAEAPGFAIPALVFLSKTPWRSCALVPLTPDFHEHRRAPVQRAGK